MSLRQRTSYRLHAKRYGTRRIATILRARGYSLYTALAVLACKGV